MNTNLLAMSITKEEKTDKWGNLYIVQMTIQDSLIGQVKLPAFYMREGEYKLLIECARGNSAYYPYIDDISYLLKIGPDSARIIDLNQYSTPIKNQWGSKVSGEYRQYFVEFPFQEIVTWLIVILQDSEFTTFELSQSTIERLTMIYAPRVSIEWGESCNPVEDTTFTDCLASLERIAKNNSSGELVTVNIYADGQHDGYPCYYWDMRREDNSRILNGGIVYHEANPGYQIHT